MRKNIPDRHRLHRHALPLRRRHTRHRRHRILHRRRRNKAQIQYHRKWPLRLTRIHQKDMNHRSIAACDPPLHPLSHRLPIHCGARRRDTKRHGRHIPRNPSINILPVILQNLRPALPKPHLRIPYPFTIRHRQRIGQRVRPHLRFIIIRHMTRLVRNSNRTPTDTRA